MDKQTFLNRIRAAEMSSGRTQNIVEFFDADTVSFPVINGLETREAFEKNFANNHGDIISSPENIAEFLKSKGCKKGVIDSALDTTFGLESEFEITREFDRQNPDSFDFGISRASMAIAESGAIVLKDSSTSDRMATIAPWVHIAVIDKNTIERTIPEALAKIVDCPYAIVISGPSKTTDVEGVLVEGVHGPGVQACLII